ncbi:MAG: TIGR04290 family methyltransferase [Rhodospirillaceae bacterium]|nr:TIGR04290 family methyltransferase [Rhodospirillaceae bacterium]
MTAETAATAIDRGDIRALGPWFHNLHLPGGVQTAPDSRYGDFPAWKWAQLAPHIPEDLSGRHALDIGCNAGFYSFELARRGARVTAIDHDPHYLAQARWAARYLDARRLVRFELCDVYGLARWQQRFDLVLFMGVLYHLRYPLLALDSIARLTPRLLVVQTLTMPGEALHEAAQEPLDFEDRWRMAEPGWPLMAFIEGAFAGDPTNWWAPNRACTVAMLRNVGFDVVAEPGHEIFVCRNRDPRRPPPFWTAEWEAATGLVR